MNIHQPNNFLFAAKYRGWRHVTFFLFQTSFFTLVWVDFTGFWNGLLFNSVGSASWLLYCYPLIYWILPFYLLKGRYRQFVLLFFLWIIAGCIWSHLHRIFVLLPLQYAVNFERPTTRWQAGQFLAMTTTAGFASMVVLFKHWTKKQQEWLQAEKEKVSAELQLLKAQVHPHFLFNTLNNIYSFSLQNSAKTPNLILKLSSLLSYMLYDCKADEVQLEKELEVMRNYIDLEKERYGNQLELSLNTEGNTKNQFIAPLLLLPFLENAFKHGTSEQLEKPWLSVDIAIKNNLLRCKIANSKNEFVPFRENGIGIQNVKKRLQFLYPDNHELKLNDEGAFFVASLMIALKSHQPHSQSTVTRKAPFIKKVSA